MWTPKRIVMLAFGLVLFLAIYIVYATSSLGRINGLPPLPEAYYPVAGPSHPILPPSERKPTGIDAKLVQAFGPNCPELNFAIRLELHSKSMVLAAAQFQVLPDGRVCLTPFSVALFGKDRGDGRGIEINTIQGRVAHLKFDRPISSLSPNELGGRKIEEAELNGDIVVVNNRRTARRDDDLWLNIPVGPLYYNELKHLVWTHDRVHLVDHQSKPNPHEVRGKGMRMELIAESAASATSPGRAPSRPGSPPGRKSKGESITGVRRILLTSDVEMNLYVDGRSGFPGGSKEQAQPGAVGAAGAAGGEKGGKPAAPAEKAHLTVKTPGPFVYEFFKDHDMAHFDVPGAAPDRPSRVPQDVTVVRHHPEGKTDQLVCKHLDLRLHRKDSPPPSAASANSGEGPADRGVEIETAHATAGGRDVVLTSDTEKLRAEGNDLFYDSSRQLTVLKGNPEMEADKAGSIIHAREMQIQEVKAPSAPGTPPRSFQQVTAIGPGSIHLLDTKTEQKTVHAYWNDRLTSSKDGALDLLVLTGLARFVDDEHDQTLQGEIVKVWLNTGDKGKEGSTEASAQQARRPQHLEATGNVIARSAEMHVHDTGRLVVWFKDVPAAEVLPATVSPEKSSQAGGKTGPAAARGAAAPSGPGKETGKAAIGPASKPAPVPAPARDSSGPAVHQAEKSEGPVLGSPAAAPAGPAPPDKSKSEPPRPIDLSARSVEAWVLRSEVKNTLDKLWCEGSVHVRQDPAKPEEKGVDIKGDTLQMTYNPAGNYLVVTGDLAQLRMDKIYILGPEVNIDQATNKAWVYGPGAMQMESDTDFQGNKLERTVPLTIHWIQNMLFNGADAEFHGGIQAEQDNALMAGQQLQVFFDRPISLKEGNHSEQPARVRRLVCDENVRVEDSTVAGGRLVKYQHLRTPSLTMEALEPEDDDPHPREKDNGHLVRASGPGNVRIWQRGGPDPLATPAPTTAGKAPAGTRPAAKPSSGASSAEEEMKLTYVAFGKRMDANNKTHMAYFWEDVRVLNIPSDKPTQEVDLDALLLAPLPEKALYLRCDRLKVLDQPEGGRSNQQMEAKGRVYVQGKDFYARADEVHYNQAKDQVIFIGSRDRTATLYKVKRVGDKPEELTGRMIIYNRTTGEASSSDSDYITGH